MDWGIILGIIGIVLTVVFGIPALRAMNKKTTNKISQTQKSEGGSTSIQSGRDTNIND